MITSAEQSSIGCEVRRSRIGYIASVEDRASASRSPLNLSLRIAGIVLRRDDIVRRRGLGSTGEATCQPSHLPQAQRHFMDLGSAKLSGTWMMKLRRLAELVIVRSNLGSAVASL